MKYSKLFPQPVTVPPPSPVRVSIVGAVRLGHPWLILARLLVLVAVLLIGGVAQGATLYWDGGSDDLTADGNGASDGGDGTWDDSILNWDQGNSAHVRFSTGDLAIFSGTSGVVTLGADMEAFGVVFNVDGYTLSGTNTLTLQEGGMIANGITNINVPLALGAGQSWRVALGEQLIIGGRVNTNGWALGIQGGGNTTISGTVSGAGSITIDQNTLLTLTERNTYSGGTVLNSGVLQIGHNEALGAGLVTLNGGEIYSTSTAARTIANDLLFGNGVTFGNPANNGRLIFTGTSLDFGGAVPQFTVVSDVTMAGGLANGGMNKLGAGTLLLTGTNTYADVTSIAAGTLEIGGAGNLGNGNYAADISNEGALLINTTANQTLSGELSGGGSLTKSNNGTLILCGTNTFTGATTINWGILRIGGNGSLGSGDYAGNIAIGLGASLAFDTGMDQTLSGTISGEGVLTKSNSGTLVLPNANTHSGGTVLNGGSIAVGNNAALGTGLVSLFSGTLCSTSSVGRTLSNGLLIGGDVTLGDQIKNGKLVFTGADIDLDWESRQLTILSEVSIGGNIANGGLTKAGAGRLELAGTSSFSGNIAVNEGLLEIGGAGALGGSGMNYSGAISLASSGTLAVNTSVDQLLSGAISGDGTLIKASTGILKLAAGNSFSGGTILNEGGIQLGGNAALGTGPVRLNGGELSSDSGMSREVGNDLVIGGDISLGNQLTNGALVFSGTGVDLDGDVRQITTASEVTLGGALSNGGVTKTGPAALHLSGNSNYTGATTINEGILEIAQGGNLGGETANYAGAVGIGSSGTFAINSTSNQTLSGVISGGGILTKDNTGELILSGSNTYAGGTVLQDGVIKVGSDTALGSGPVTLAGGRISSDGANARTLSNEMVLEGDVTLGNAENPGEMVFSGNLNLGGGQWQLTTASAVTIAGVVSHGQLTKAGDGVLELTGTSTYEGSTVINGGMLVISGSGSLGGGDYSGEVGIANSGTLALNSKANQTLSGSITGQGAITKGGEGNLILSGTSSFEGATLVNKGLLELSGELSNTASVSVAGGASLKVNGIINSAATTSVLGTISGSGTLGALSIGDGGLLSPGNSPGVIRVGALEFSGTSARLLMEIGGTIAGVDHDQILADGPVSLNNATLQLSLLNGYKPLVSDELLLILNGDASQQDIGTFNGLADNSILKLTNDQGTFKFKLHYADYDGNGTTDVYLSGSTNTPVIWGAEGSDPLAGILDGSLIPTSTGSDYITYTNVNGMGFDVVVYTNWLNQAGAAVLPWNDQAGWWLEGGAGSGGKNIPYSTVEFRFYETGTTIPYGLSGVKFRFEDAENGERFRNFGFWNSKGDKLNDAFYDPGIFSFSAKPVAHFGDGSVDNGVSYSGGTQEDRWIEVDLSAFVISGFTFQAGRYSSYYGSVIMTGLGENLAPGTELLIQSGTQRNISAGPDFSATGADALVSGSSVITAWNQQDVSISSLDGQNILINTLLASGSGHAMRMDSPASIVSATSSVRTSSTTGNAGSITLNADQSIIVPYLETWASSGSGGNVSLSAGNDVKIGTGIDTNWVGSVRRSGDVSIDAGNNLIVGTIRTGGGAGVAASGTAGNVTLTAGAAMKVEAIYAQSTSGNEGNIALSAGDSIKVGAIYAQSAPGSGGAVTLTAPSISLGNSGAVAAAITGTMLLQKPVGQSEASIAILGTVTGPGSLVIDAGTGRSDLYSSATLTGTTRVLSGILALNGNSLASSDLVLAGSSSLLSGVTNIGGSVSVKSLTLGTAATLVEEISNSSIYDKIQASGAVSLDGIFSLQLGFDYKPVVGQRYQVMSFASSTGTFGAYQGLRISGSVVLLPELNATSMWLQASYVTQTGSLPLRSVPPEGIQIAAGESYDGLTVASQGLSLITNATIVGGTASQDTTVHMALQLTGTAGFQATGTSGSLTSNLIRGYVLDLEGTMPDMFVLELEYKEDAVLAAVGDERNMFVCSSDGGPFKNAVDTNIGPDNNPTQFFRGYNPATDFHLGYYGVDTVNNRVWAVLDHNSAFGLGVRQFPAISGAICSSQSANPVAGTSALLNGLVHPNGYATSACFEYGTDPGLIGSSTSATITIDSKNGFVPVSIPVNKLASASTYYFRVTGVTSSGTNKGSILSFVTQPVVSVRTLVADAYELDASCGQFEISQSGSASLNVRYSISGTASNGRRFSLPSGPVTIPAGATSMTLNVSPLANNLFDGDESVVISLESGNDYEVGAASSASVTIHDKPLDQWKGWAFGAEANNPAVSGDGVVNNGAGISNLMAYGLGLEPRTAKVSGLPATGRMSEGGSNYLAMSFTRNPKAKDVVYSLQASNDLVTWTEIGVCRGGAWTHSGNVAETQQGDLISVHARDIQAIGSSKARFIRMQLGH